MLAALRLDGFERVADLHDPVSRGRPEQRQNAHERDRDDGNDEHVFGQALSGLVPPESSQHRRVLVSESHGPKVGAWPTSGNLYPGVLGVQ